MQSLSNILPSATLHYATLMTRRPFGCYFFHFFISNTMTFRLSRSLSRSFVSRACIIVSLCRTSQIKRCHSWEIKDEESSAGKNYCLSSFFLSIRPPRSLFVFLLRSLSRSRALSVSPSLALSRRSFAIPLLCDPSRPDGFTTHTRHEHRRASHGLLLKLVCCRARRTAMRAGELRSKTRTETRLKRERRNKSW